MQFHEGDILGFVPHVNSDFQSVLMLVGGKCSLSITYCCC
jgi:hypothetical protein